MDTDRIGGIGVTCVNQYIWSSGYMKPDIRHHDNIPIWDGDIYVYATENDLNNNNFKFRVPTQVKSHYHESGDFPNMPSFPIETKNLNNYLAEGGVIFFLVYIREYESQIYVNYLSKAKIKEIIKGKEKQESISIKFTKITNDESEFISELESFNLQRRFNTRPLLNYNKNEKLEIVFDKKKYGLENANEEEFSQFIATHSIDILFKPSNENEYYYPEEGRLTLQRVEDCIGLVRFGKYNFRTYYRKINSQFGKHYIIENGWLIFTQPYDRSVTASMRLNYEFTKFKDIVRVSEILINLFKTTEISFNEKDTILIQPFDKSNPDYKSIFNAANFWLKFKRLCDVLHIYHDFYISDFDDEDIKKIIMLYEAYVNKKEVTTANLDDHLTMTVIKNLNILSLVKITRKNKARLLDFAEQMVVAYKQSEGNGNDNKNNEMLIATPFSAAFAHDVIPSNIQLDNICAAYSEALKINPNLIDRANIDLLNLINHYDKTQRKELLDAAFKLSNWILQNCGENNYHIHKINILQLKIRMGESFSEKEIEWLTLRYEDTEDKVEKFILTILLKETYRSKRLYNQLSSEEKENIANWPIMHLFKLETNG